MYYRCPEGKRSVFIRTMFIVASLYLYMGIVFTCIICRKGENLVSIIVCIHNNNHNSTRDTSNLARGGSRGGHGGQKTPLQESY